jgi:aminoglycoside phosphotransferase family enzyme
VTTAAPPAADLAALLAGLADPAAYPHPTPGGVEVRQTHISAVFLAGDRAYKLKKPVALGFVDYATPARRRHFCEEELRLNRRLAPDVYLAVAPVTRTGDGRLRVGGNGPAVDWVVVMRRLPDAATLEATLARRALRPGQLEAVARRLAAFHAAAAPAPAGRGFGTASAVERAIEENLAALDRAAADGLLAAADTAAIARGCRTALAAASGRIDARARAGRVRECHGDLRLDHVYLFPKAPPPGDCCVIDGIEFNDAFRYIDPVADIAFLVMDLGVHGHVAEAVTFADAWFAASGDGRGRALLPLYALYRATVRAKVEVIRSRAPEVGPAARDDARSAARRHVQYARALLARP